jgi:hypothetical protein
MRESRIGKTFDRLTFVRKIAKGAEGNVTTQYECRCECGTIVRVQSGVLGGGTKSCGCLKRERDASTRHGQKGTPTYNSWHSMMQRCHDKNHFNYCRYGGRGITVCAEWQSFSGFWGSMGDRPEGENTRPDRQ